MKVYHVEIMQADGKSEHHYFGSQAAIFEWLTRNDLGISLNALRNRYNLAERPYRNGRVIIRLGTLRRKETKRGGRRD